MRGILVCLAVGMMSMSVSVAGAQESQTPPKRTPAPPQRTPGPPTRLFRVVYHAQHEHHKRFQTANQADVFASRLRAEGFTVEIRPGRQRGEVREFEVRYRLSSERTKTFGGPQGETNARSFMNFLRDLNVHARLVNAK